LIAIVDYGVGNLKSVEKAFSHIGCDVVVTSDADTVNRADAVVLPGVGAFDAAMANLVGTGLHRTIEHVISVNKPFLGICLGMQLLFDFSEEGANIDTNASTSANTNASTSASASANTCASSITGASVNTNAGGAGIKGLGIFKGGIRQLPAKPGIKVPHMGWNSINTAPDCALFQGLPANPYVYFVHSYYLHAEDRKIVSSTVSYGMDFDSSISVGNIHATQFHPEKSGELGLNILRNFIRLVNEK